MTIKSFFQKIFSPIVVGNCLGMVVVTALLIFGTLQFLQCYTDHGEAVVVPNIRGMKTDVAESKMKALGLRLEVKDMANRAPPTPEKKLEITKDSILCLNRLMPMASAATSSSRMALKARP